MKKEKLLTVGLWLIVAYAVGLLTFCTHYFVLNKSDAYISAFGSILSAVATFSASFIAVYLFNDWKIQHNKQVQNQISLTVYDSFLSLNSKINELANELSNLQDLIHGYDNLVSHYALHREGNSVYLTNVTRKSEEAGLIFYEFLFRLKTLLTVIGQIETHEKKHNFYFEQFTRFHKYPLDIDYIQDEINRYESILIGYKDLLETLRSGEIDPILKQLQV